MAQLDSLFVECLEQLLLVLPPEWRRVQVEQQPVDGVSRQAPCAASGWRGRDRRSSPSRRTSSRSALHRRAGERVVAALRGLAVGRARSGARSSSMSPLSAAAGSLRKGCPGPSRMAPSVRSSTSCLMAYPCRLPSASASRMWMTGKGKWLHNVSLDDTSEAKVCSRLRRMSTLSARQAWLTI